jgi:hypothetical protein
MLDFFRTPAEICQRYREYPPYCAWEPKKDSVFGLFQLLLGIYTGVLFRWIHAFLWIVSLESLEVRTLWSSGKKIGSVIAYTTTTYGIGRCLEAAYVSPLCRPDNLCPVLMALSRSVRIFRYILQKSVAPVAPFDRNFRNGKTSSNISWRCLRPEVQATATNQPTPDSLWRFWSNA